MTCICGENITEYYYHDQYYHDQYYHDHMNLYAFLRYFQIIAFMLGAYFGLINNIYVIYEANNKFMIFCRNTVYICLYLQVINLFIENLY